MPSLRSRVVRDLILIVSITVSLLYLIRLIECRSKLPKIRVNALIYDQSTDTFSLDTQPIPWWSVRALAHKIEIRTITPDGVREGLFPHPDFRVREIVDYPDPTLDAYWPGYILSKDLPRGKSYSPTKEWEIVSGLRYKNDAWHMERTTLSVNDTDLDQPIPVAQFRNYYPARSPEEHTYTFHIRAMGGIASKGLGRTFEPTIRDHMQRAFRSFIKQL